MANATNFSSPIEEYWSHPVSKGFRHLFYIVLPSESSFQYKDEVPDYVNGVSTTALLSTVQFLFFFQFIRDHIADLYRLQT